MRLMQRAAILNRLPGFGLALSLALSVAALALGACSASLNWRLVDLAGPGQAYFPCRPELRERQVALEGASFSMRQSACDAQAMTFAVTTVRPLTPAAPDLASDAAADRLMQALARAAANNIGAALPPDPAGPSSDTGAPVRRWSLTGQRSDGQAVTVELILLRRGAWVLQGAVVGTAPRPEAIQTFVDGLTGRL